MIIPLALSLLAFQDSTPRADPPRALRVGEAIEAEVTDDEREIHTTTLDAGDGVPTLGRTFELEVTESGTYTIGLRSYSFDAYLVLRAADGAALAEDDDGWIGTHARLVQELQAGTPYRLEACALHGDRGPFELTLEPGTPSALSELERADLELADAERRAEVVERLEGADSTEVATALFDLGVAYWNRARYDRARDVFERSLAIHEQALGSEHADTAMVTYTLAAAYTGLGDYAAARPLYERALAIQERVLGPEHRDTGLTLNNLGNLLRYQGDYAAAQPLYERALAIRQKVLGPDHPSTISSQNNLADLLRVLGDYATARALFEQTLETAERVLGPEHPLTSTILNNLGYTLLLQGDDAGAVPILTRALAIKEKVLGPEHPETVASLTNLANAYKGLEDYAAARPLYERALAIDERVLGPEHPMTATSVGNLASLDVIEADLAGARARFERAIVISAKALGPEHPETAAFTLSLCSVLQAQGDFAAARHSYEGALAISEKAFGPEHPQTAAALGGLGTILRSQGDLDAARPLYERALAISEKVLGPEHPTTASRMIELAALYRGQGYTDAAWSLYERAVAIAEGLLGPESLMVAECLDVGGLILSARGDHAAALPLYERSLAIREAALGREHVNTAVSANNLAEGLRALGELDSARPHFEYALAVKAEVLGNEHPVTSGALHNLAMLHHCSGRPEEAHRLLSRAAAGRRTRVQGLLPGLTEAESYRYLYSLSMELELELSIEAVTEDPEITARLYEQVLEWKGRIARVLIASGAQRARDLDDEQRALVEELRRKQAGLSRILSAAMPADESEGSRRDARLARLKEERNTLELELKRAVEASEPEPAPSVAELAAALPPGGAVLDFFVHRICRPEDGPTGVWSEERLSVWILRPQQELLHLDLGPAAPIEDAVKSYLAQVVGLRADLRGVAPPEKPDGAARRKILPELLWKPIAPHLEGAETVLVSPDSFLGTLPLEVLQTEDGRYLIEDHAFVYLQDLASLPYRASEPRPVDGSLFAIGAVDYLSRAVEAPGERDVRPGSADPGLRGRFAGAWSPLRFTGLEAETVGDLHEAAFHEERARLLLQGSAATEERLKQELQRHELLHLATHGFFQPDGVPSMWDTVRSASERMETRASYASKELVGAHPGLLSGLVCAGVDQPMDAAGDDGYLTAEEVGWLDLSNVELVVLSACETGLGRAASGEGLIGLRRAFQIAGAETVISSLWSVEDASTAELMEAFYEGVWMHGMGRSEALRTAQLGMLRENRANHGEALPATWGAFVLSGEWR